MVGGIAQAGTRALLILVVLATSVSLSLGAFPRSWRGLVALCVVGLPIVVVGEWLFDDSAEISRRTRALRFGLGIALIVVLNVLAVMYREPLRAWLFA